MRLKAHLLSSITSPGWPVLWVIGNSILSKSRRYRHGPEPMRQAGPSAAVLCSPPAHSCKHLPASSAALPAACGTGRAAWGTGAESTKPISCGPAEVYVATRPPLLTPSLTAELGLGSELVAAAIPADAPWKPTMLWVSYVLSSPAAWSWLQLNVPPAGVSCAHPRSHVPVAGMAFSLVTVFIHF